jgi:uncharacterized linocin/CFP29 family protein
MEPTVNVASNFNSLAGDGKLRDRLMTFNMDPGCLRPYCINAIEGTFIDIKQNDGTLKTIKLSTNTNTSLTKEAWIAMDTSIMRTALKQLRLVADLRAAGLTYTLPNGLASTVFEYQRMTDINDAEMSMDPAIAGKNDRPEFDLAYLPLPVIHKDFQLNIRQLMASRNGGAPLDTSMGDGCARKIGEYVEKLAIGEISAFSNGGGTIYGMTNFTGALTKTLTDPSDTAWTPKTLLDEVLAMREQAKAVGHYGPFRLYFSPAWDTYLDGDFSTNYPNKTLRMRLLEVEGIGGVTTIPYMSDTTCVMLEMNSEVMRMIIGLDIMTLEWDELGGLRKNYKVMTIQVPQVRADIAGNTGIVVGTV